MIVQRVLKWCEFNEENLEEVERPIGSDRPSIIEGSLVAHVDETLHSGHH